MTTVRARGKFVYWPWLLIAITAFGTWLRFYNLTFPALWNDETLVFWRVCGSYGQMLRPLSTDGFPPLHYSFYWLLGNLDKAAWVPWTWPVVGILIGVSGTVLAVLYRRLLGPTAKPIGWVFAGLTLVLAARLYCGHSGALHWFYIGWAARHVKLTPYVMRAVVAGCGAATIPAMYFMARQMVDRRTSMIATLFTACSAFMLFYSRDAKMYADLWLFECLNIGCLLWWFRTKGSTAWLCWIASGCAMVGVHRTGYVGVALSVLMYFTQRKTSWKAGIFYVFGLALIVSGDVGYLLKFSKWIDKLEATGRPDYAWVNWYNGDRGGDDMALYGTTTFLTGWEWPRDDYVDRLNPYDPTDQVHPDKAGLKKLREKPREFHAPEPIRDWLLVGPKTAFELSALLLAIGLIPWPARLKAPVLADDPSPLWRWQIFLWIGCWIIVVGYGFYSHSVEDFSPPRDWFDWAADYFTPAICAVVVGSVIAGALICMTRLRSWGSVGKLVVSTLVVVALYWAMVGIHIVMTAANKQEVLDNAYLPRWQFIEVWLPRYLGVIWPAFGIAVAALIMRMPTRPLRTATVVFLMLSNLAIFGLRMSLGSEPPIDRLCQDEWISQDPKSTVRCYDGVEFHQYSGDIAVAGTTMAPNYGPDGITVDGGRYYMQMLANRTPMSPTLFNLSLGNQIKPENQYELREFMTPAEIKDDLANAPQVKTMILWTRIGANENPTRPPWCSIQIGGKEFYGPYNFSPKSWKQTGEETFVVRIPWEWRERCTWVRRVYTRVEPA